MKTLTLKRICLIMTLGLCTLAASAQDAYGEIRGLIKNAELEPVGFATIKILQGSQLIGGAQSDEQGNYKFKPLRPGSYELVVMQAEYATQQVNKIDVKANSPTYVDVQLSANALNGVTVTAKPIDYTRAGVDINMYTIKSIDGTDLMKLSGYTSGDLQGAITSLVSDVVQDQSGLHFRGTRGDASANYIDGVKTYGSTSVPGLAIENVTVFSGGVPAMYGDVMGGVVIITTKSYFSGIRDKNIRNAEHRERVQEEKRKKAAEEDARARKLQIELEKAKTADSTQVHTGQ